MLTVTDYNFNTTVDIFPNPSDGIINVRFSNRIQGSIVVLNQLGQEVAAKNLGSSLQSSIDLSRLKPGIYFIKIGDRINTRIAIY